MTGPTALAEWRAKQGKTQKQVADALGVSQASIGNWELGKKTPKATHMLLIERMTAAAVPMAAWADERPSAKTDPPPSGEVPPADDLEARAG